MDEQYENITDLITQTMDEATNDTTQETQYTQQDEAQARQRASQAFAESRAKQAVEQVKPKQTSTVKKDDVKEIIQKQSAEIEELKKTLSDAVKLINSTKEATERNSDRFITEDVRKEEEEIKSNPIIGHYYDDKVRAHYAKVAREEGRYLSPYEALMAVHGYEIAKELNEYKSKEDFKRKFMEEGFGGKSIFSQSGDGLDEVSDVASAQAEMRRRAAKYAE